MNDLLRSLLFGAALLFQYAHILFAQGPDWQHVRTGQTSAVITQPGGVVVAINDRDGSTHRSTDGGNTWTTGGTLPAAMETGGVVFLGADDRGTLFAGGSQGVYGLARSTDNGTTWQMVPVLEGLSVWGLASAPQGELYLATEPLGLLYSADGGVSWFRVASEVLPVAIWSVALDADGTILAGAQGEGIFRSTDNGLTWTNPMGSGVIVGLDVAEDGTMYAASGGIFRSTDDGVTWSATSLDQQRGGWDAKRVRVDGATGRLYALTEKGLFRSDDEGETWESVGVAREGAYFFDMTIDEGGSVYVAGTTGIYRFAGSASSAQERDLAGSFDLAVLHDPREGVPTILLYTGEPALVRLDLYDLHGRRVASFCDGELEAGEHRFAIDLPEGCPSGAYLCRASLDGAAVAKPMVIAR